MIKHSYIKCEPLVLFYYLDDVSVTSTDDLTLFELLFLFKSFPFISVITALFSFRQWINMAWISPAQKPWKEDKNGVVQSSCANLKRLWKSQHYCQRWSHLINITGPPSCRHNPWPLYLVHLGNVLLCHLQVLCETLDLGKKLVCIVIFILIKGTITFKRLFYTLIKLY